MKDCGVNLARVDVYWNVFHKDKLYFMKKNKKEKK